MAAAAAAIQVFESLQRDVERLTVSQSQLNRQIQVKQEQLIQLQQDYDELQQHVDAAASRQEQLLQKIQVDESYLAATRERVEEKVGEWAGRKRAAKQKEQELQQKEQELQQWEEELQQWEQELQQWQEDREYRDQVDIDLEMQETQYMHLSRETERLILDENQLQVQITKLKEEAAAAQETKRVRKHVVSKGNVQLIEAGLTIGGYM